MLLRSSSSLKAVCLWAATRVSSEYVEFSIGLIIHPTRRQSASSPPNKIVIMKEPLVAILPGITIYAIISFASQFVLTQLWKVSHVLARFFRDSADGRSLSRVAGYRLNISETEESRMYTRLVRSVKIVTWFRYISLGTVLVFMAGVVAIVFSPTSVIEQFRLLVLVASAVVSYCLVRRNERIVTGASDRREY